MAKLTFFTEEEIKGLDTRLALLLDQMRSVAGIPIIITSGLRTPEENLGTEGKPNSAHLYGFAADIACTDSASRYKLVKAAFAVGFRRIEVATRHVHVDIDETKDQDVLWVDVSK